MRALNRNQLLILGSVAKNRSCSITAVLQEISCREGIALSTLKVNSRILRNLGIIEFGDTAMLTRFGTDVLAVLAGHALGKEEVLINLYRNTNSSR